MIFTIAIPTYNNAQTVHLAIESAINQDFRNDDYEVLVINNNCTDETDEILKRYNDRIRIVKNDKTVLMYENHNIGLKKGSGEYIIFCHSDDQLLPDALLKYYNIIKERGFPSRYILWGRSMFRDFYVMWNEGGFQLNQIASGINSLKAFQGGLTPSGTCYSRESFLHIGGFINGKNKLAPYDLVTMWKLVINYFEFEMSDRIFFIRKYASTASGAYFNNKNIYESIKDAVYSLTNDLPNDQMRLIINYFEACPIFNPLIFNILIELKLLNRKLIQRKTIKMLIRNPFIVRHKEFRKLLFNTIIKN